MARTALVKVTSSRVAPTLFVSDDPDGDFVAIDAVNGMVFTNKTNKTILVIANTSGANALTVTVKTNYSINGITLPDESQAIPAGETCIIGPFPAIFEQATAKAVNVDFSGTSPSGKILAMDVEPNDA